MEKKRAYVKPSLESEAFVPNTYVAACGDSGTTYLFKCDAGGGVSGNVYLETNGVPGLQTEGKWVGGIFGHWEYRADTSLGGYHACGTTHEADSDDDFLDGYYVPYRSNNTTKVIVWRGPHNNNVHCTTNLNKDSWEIAKSN